jgi:hypothetical protein
MAELTQFMGTRQTPGEATPDTHIGIDDADLDFTIPGPHEDPDLWDTVWIDKIPLPPVGMGVGTLKLTASAKTDSKGGAGKAKPRQSKTGGEQTKATCTIKFIEEAWPAMLAACRTLQPGSGPHKVGHPKADMANLRECTIKSWKDAPTPDVHGEFTWEFDVEEVAPEAQKGDGGKKATDTPTGATGDRTAGSSSGPLPTAIAEAARANYLKPAADP